MISDISAARDVAVADIESATDLDQLASMATRYAGKKGELSGLKKLLGSLESIDDKKQAGAAINEAMAAVDTALAERRSAIELLVLAERIEAESLDLTEYVGTPTRGRKHLVTQAWERLEDVFVGLGFRVAEGPEVETDWHNFEALNMGEGHPARGEFDTLFVDHAGAGAEPGSTVLRTHTSPVQIRTMEATEPPVRIIVPGRTYRSDHDATHSPMFHQCEGLVIGDGIHMGHLKGCLIDFCRAFFGVDDLPVRFRPSYFPFTEPSAEFDIQRPDGSWLELGGCGMVHPSVIRAGGLDPDEWSGFAFGFGIDRMAVMRHGVADIRDMYVNDIRFVEQF